MSALPAFHGRAVKDAQACRERARDGVEAAGRFVDEIDALLATTSPLAGAE